jgi:hypothetical protein
MPGDPSTTTCNTAVMTSCTPAAGDDKKEHAVLQVMLKRTARKVVPATGLFDKLFFGDKEWAQESLDQAHYLNQIYQSFAALGYDNIILMVVNEKVVYKDTQRQPGDFATALRLALDEQVQEDFDIAFALDKGQDGKPDFAVKFKRLHATDEYPLRIEVMNDDVTTNQIAALEEQLRKHFDVEEIEKTQR